ncbi:MAG: DUF401 family protein [Desulfobacterales bacterium]|jgi:integral membrane protein (TIGR00529 family)|nr:DUF401 family protein [Desulfobacterales bacterium]
MNIPALIKLLIVFIFMLAAMRFKLTLGNAFMAGAVLLGLFFGQYPTAIIVSAFHALIDLKTLSLSIVVSLILVLSHSMEKSGHMKRLLDSFKGLVAHEGFNIIIFPALIGLLPMPGGAIFSAPMVNTIGARHHLRGSQLSYVNYWFRHIWEYWWPLYPGVLLTTALASLDLWRFVFFLFPLTLVAIAAGYYPLRGMIRKNNQLGEKKPTEKAKLGLFFKELAPILIVVIPGLFIGNMLTPVFEREGLTIAKETGLIFALMLAVAWTWWVNCMNAASQREILGSKELLRIFYMVVAILVFKGALEDCRAVEQVSREFIHWHIPLLLITTMLPFLVGIVAGITIAFVGTTFPILISLIQTLGETHLMLPYMMLALTSGFIGVLFSPLHLCLLLSNEYFHTSLTAVYRHMLPPCAALVACGAAYFWLLTLFFEG